MYISPWEKRIKDKGSENLDVAEIQLVMETLDNSL